MRFAFGNERPMSQSPAPSPMQPHTSAGRLLTLACLFIGFAALGTWAVYDQFAGQSLSFDRRLLHWSTLLPIAGLLLVYFVADGLRLHFTLRALGQYLPLKRLFSLVFINIFFSNITPMATGGGFAQMWYLQRHGVSMGIAGAATTIRTLLAVIFIFTLTPIYLLTSDVLRQQAFIGAIGGWLAVLILMYLGFFAVVLLRTRWLIIPLSGLFNTARRLQLISDTRHRHWQFALRREMLRFARSFKRYIGGKRSDVVLSIVFTMVFLLSLFSFPALLIASLGYHIDYLVSVGLLVVTTFIMYFSPTPGASGISEGVFGSVFSPLLGVEHLVLVTITWRVLTIYLGMIAGLILTQMELSRARDAT